MIETFQSEAGGPWVGVQIGVQFTREDGTENYTTDDLVRAFAAGMVHGWPVERIAALRWEAHEHRAARERVVEVVVKLSDGEHHWTVDEFLGWLQGPDEDAAQEDRTGERVHDEQGGG